MPIDPGLGQDESDEPPIDPGLSGQRPYIPPDPDIPHLPSSELTQEGIILGGVNSLSIKYQTYGGVGANCRSRSTDWGDMGSMPYWLEGSVNAPMSGSTVTLTTDSDTTDSVNAIVAPNSYVELSVTFTVGGHDWFEPTSTSFEVCLESDDEITASVGEDGVIDFSIVKNGIERIAFSEIAVFNETFSAFSITLTIDKAVHCAYAAEAEPDAYTGTADDEVVTIEEGPIDAPDDDEGGDGARFLSEWTRDDSWVLLGLLVLLLLGGYVLNTVRGDEDCD